jgi:hypothetical protein
MLLPETLTDLRHLSGNATYQESSSVFMSQILLLDLLGKVHARQEVLEARIGAERVQAQVGFEKIG